MQAAKGHLVEAADEFTIRNQSQEIGKNKFSCYPLSPWIKCYLKPTSIILVAQNSKFLYGFCYCFLYIYTHTGREIIDIGIQIDIDVLFIYLLRKRDTYFEALLM